MTNKTASIAERITELVNHFSGGNNSKFGLSIGTSEANIRNYRNGTIPKFDVIISIAEKYELNFEWLLLGKGQMLFKEYSNSKKELVSDFVNEPMEDVIAKQVNKADLQDGGIPLVSNEAIGGFGNFDFAIKQQDIQSLYKVPDFININFMIRVKGSSMYPKYNSGDVVACRIIRESQFIQWNKVHVIATKEQGILIKRLKKSSKDELLVAISDNKDYDPFEIPKDEITGLAIVVGVIRLE